MGEWKAQDDKGTWWREGRREREKKGLGKERKGRRGVNRDVMRIKREGGEK